MAQAQQLGQKVQRFFGGNWHYNIFGRIVSWRVNSLDLYHIIFEYCLMVAGGC